MHGGQAERHAAVNRATGGSNPSRAADGMRRKLTWWKRWFEAPEVLVRFQPDALWPWCSGIAQQVVALQARVRISSVTPRVRGHGDQPVSKSGGRGSTPRGPAHRSFPSSKGSGSEFLSLGIGVRIPVGTPHFAGMVQGRRRGPLKSEIQVRPLVPVPLNARVAELADAPGSDPGAPS